MNGRDQRELNRLRGEAARARGGVSEELVLTAVHRVPGVVGARMGTLAEDAEGKDIIVQVVDGSEIYLQVKSSHMGARSFRESRSGLGPGAAPPIAAVVASFDEEKLLRRVKSALRAAYFQLTRGTKSWPDGLAAVRRGGQSDHA